MHKIYMTEKTGVVFLWIKCCENCAPGFWPNYRAQSAKKIKTCNKLHDGDEKIRQKKMRSQTAKSLWLKGFVLFFMS